jgi:translation initiation factor 2B subunit (eIF-2B alpha/beta/delta family)
MPDIPDKIKEILNDNISGSKELLSQINNYFSKSVQPDEFNLQLLTELKDKFREFSAIENYLQNLISLIKAGKDPKDFFEEFNYHENSLPKLLLTKLKPFLKPDIKIITLSNSKTLLDVFLLLRKEREDFEIIVSESRPQNEGAIMGEMLSNNGIKTTLITEAMLGSAAKEADIGIIGADKILRDNSVINKTGSLTLAIALRFYSKPLLVLADKTKKSDEISFTPELYPPEEIIKNKKSMMQVTNYYFERVDATLITNILTD